MKFLQENRISDLKADLESERKTKEAELAESLSEQKKLAQKVSASEKEVQQLQGLIKMHEKQVIAKQEKIEQYELELKESEQMKSTILSLMQGRNGKNK